MRRRGRRVLVGIGAVCGLFGLLVILVVSPVGGALARRWVTEAANARLVGRVSIDVVKIRPPAIDVAGITLRDRQGVVVASVERVRVRLSPTALLRGRVVVSHAQVAAPRLRLVATEGGLTLSHALQTRPGPPGESTSEPGGVFVLQALAVRDGVVVMEDARVGKPAGARQVAGIDLDASARYDGGTGTGQADMAGTAGTSTFRARARRAADGQVSVGVSHARIEPGLVAAVWPAAALRAPVRLQATGRLSPGAGGDVFDGQVRIAIAAASVELKGHGTRSSTGASRFRVQVRGRDLDLSQVFAAAPSSRFTLALEGEASKSIGQPWTAEVRAELPAGGSVGGRPLGPARLRGGGGGDRWTLRALEATLPGLRLTATGHVADDTVELAATVNASDLGLLARSLAPREGPAVPLLGRGELTLRLSGSLSGPAVQLDVRLPRLAVAGSAARGVEVAARLPRLNRPWQGQVRVHAGRVQIGDMIVRQAHVALSGDPDRRIVARSRARLRGPGRVSLDLRGRVASDLRAFTLDRLSLAIPPNLRSNWTLAAPAVVSWRQPGLVIQELALTSGPQRLSLDLRQGARGLSGRVHAERIDLAPFEPFLPARARPTRGRVSLRLDWPAGSGRVRVEGGAIGPVRRLWLEGNLGRDRASGQFRGRLAGAPIRGRFDLPNVWPPAPAARLSLALSAEDVPLDRVLPATAVEAAGRVRGRADVHVLLSGTANDPALDARAALRDLVVRGRRLGAVAVVVRRRPDGPLAASVDVPGLGAGLNARLSSPARPLALLTSDPAALRETPFELQLEASGVPIEPLAALAGRAGKIGGEASMTLAVEGPLASPAGNARFDLRRVRGSGIPATDAELTLGLARQRGLRAALNVQRRDRRLAAVEANLSLASSDLIALDRSRLFAAPIRLDARLGPIALRREGLAGPGAGPLSSTVEAAVALRGTLDAPRLQAEVHAGDIRLQDARLGRGQARLTYEQGRPRLQLTLVQPAGGQLKLNVALARPISPRALLAQTELAMIPLEADLQANSFSLLPLSGVTEQLHRIEGHLDADVRLRGHLRAPEVDGRFEWRDGLVALDRAGEFRDIHLVLWGDERVLVLEQLTARSGEGTARLVGRAVRAAGKTPGETRLALTAQARLDRFRLHAEGQPVGDLTLALAASGTASPEQISVRAKIDEGRLSLADDDRKDLPPLERPPDIVLFRHGVPLDDQEARKWAALGAPPRREDQPDPGAPPGAVRTASSRDRRPGLTVTVDAPRDLWLRGNGLNLELGLSRGFQVQLDSGAEGPEVFGTVTVHRGQLDLLGRRFEVKSGSRAQFDGPPLSPRLDVEARFEAPRAGITVVASVVGPPASAKISLASPEHPEYGEAELLAVLVTGRPPDQPGRAVSPTARAATFAGRYLARRLERALAGRVPLDVLEIDPGQDLRAPRVEAGTYLRRHLYVAYVGRLGAEVNDPMRRQNRNELQLEYQISRRWSFEASYGDARQGAADVVWSKSY